MLPLLLAIGLARGDRSGSPSGPEPDKAPDRTAPAQGDGKPGDQAAPPDPPEARDAVDWTARVAGLVEKLGSRRYRQRERASKQLAQLPASALPAVLDAWRQARQPEIRLRLRLGADPLILAHLCAGGGKGVGFLGISFSSTITARTRGMAPGMETGLVVYVSDVVESTPAAASKLAPGDRIVAVGDKRVWSFASAETFAAHLASLQPGTRVQLYVERGGQFLTFPVRIGHRLLDAPEPLRTQWRREAVEAFWDKQEQSAR
jgi:hypothetical protein